MTNTTKVSSTDKQHMSLKKIVTAYFADGKTAQCEGVTNHIVALGYGARGASAILSALLADGVLTREGKRGYYVYSLVTNPPAMEMPKGRPCRIGPIQAENRTVNLSNKVNDLLLSARRRANV